MALREDILSCDDIVKEELYIPEWKTTIWVKVMSGEEKDQWEASRFDKNGKPKMEQLRARIVVQVAVDKDGKRLFTNDDIAALSKKNANALERVMIAASKLNQISDAEIEELAKNS